MSKNNQDLGYWGIGGIVFFLWGELINSLSGLLNGLLMAQRQVCNCYVLGLATSLFNMTPAVLFLTTLKAVATFCDGTPPPSPTRPVLETESVASNQGVNGKYIRYIHDS